MVLLLGLSTAACRGKSKEHVEYATKVHPPLMAATSSTAKPCAVDRLSAQTVRLQSSPGIKVMLTYMRTDRPSKGAVVLMHGAGSPSSSIWDLNFEDYSVMRRLACEGFDSYALDARGFGGSDKPPAAPSGQPVAVRAVDVMSDMRAAVAFARQTSKLAQVDVVGWSWGCVVSGMYAGLHPDDVRRLLLFAPVYDRKWKSRHAKTSKWKALDKQLFYKYHDPKRERREVLDLHVQQLFQYAEPDGRLRISNGPYFDIYGPEGPVWDPANVRAPTCVLRGDADRASKAEAAQRLTAALANTGHTEHIVLPGAGHFAFRTLRYRAFQDAVVNFLTKPLPSP